MNGLDHFVGPSCLLLLLVAVPLVVYLSRNSLAGLSRTRRTSCVTLRILVVVLLVMALAEFRLLWESDRLAVIFLIDRSASVPSEHRDAMLEFIKEASQYRDRERGDAVGVVSFGRSAGIERAPRPEEIDEEFGFSTIIERDYTDLESAVRLAVAACPEGYAKRLVLISDFNENQGDAFEGVRAAVAEGATIDVLPVRYHYGGEILIDKLIVDPEVHVGEPFDIRIVVESTRETTANLRLFENQTLVHSEEDIELQPGKNVFRISRYLEKTDLYYYEAMIESTVLGDDSILQNNSANAFTFIRGQPKILLCADDPSLDRDLLAALDRERINVEVIMPGSLPVDPARYLKYDAVVLSNVASHELTQSHMKLLENLVEGAGLGFVMIGGENSFGAGGYLGSPIEEVLPVHLDAKQKKKMPNGALAIVMHSCEINNGNYWAKQTVQRAIRVLSPRDYAGVIYYDWQGGDRWLFPMLPCSNRAMMLSRLNSFAPGDMPSFEGILQKAHTGLKGVEAAIKHIIVFSDGDPQQPSPATLQKVLNDKITISTICMGWHSTPAPMQALAQAGGGNFYSLTGPDKLPEIFIREASIIRKALIQERTFVPIPRRGGSFLTGIDIEALPTVEGYIVTSEKEQADHFLSAPPSEDDPTLDPVLSSWSYGLGKSVAFTSDAGRRWTSAWVSWDSYQKFWAQIIRWVSRSRSDDRFRVTRSREGDKGVVFIDAIDPAGNFINGMTFETTVITPKEETVAAETRQVGPGRYKTEFPAHSEGVHIVSFKYTAQDRARVYSTGMTVPYSPEFRKLATNDTLVERIAEAAGGKVLGGVDDGEAYRDIFRSGFATSRAPQELWRTLLFLAAILFFADVFVRRVVVDYVGAVKTGWEKTVAFLSRRGDKGETVDGRLSALLRRKAAVQQTRTGARKFYADDLEDRPAPTLDSSFVASSREPSVSSPEPSPKPPPERVQEKEPSSSPEESYTSRLLAAKRRAIRRQVEDKDS